MPLASRVTPTALLPDIHTPPLDITPQLASSRRYATAYAAGEMNAVRAELPTPFVLKARKPADITTELRRHHDIYDDIRNTSRILRHGHCISIRRIIAEATHHTGYATSSTDALIVVNTEMVQKRVGIIGRQHTDEFIEMTAYRRPGYEPPETVRWLRRPAKNSEIWRCADDAVLHGIARVTNRLRAAAAEWSYYRR